MSRKIDSMIIVGKNPYMIKVVKTFTVNGFTFCVHRSYYNPDVPVHPTMMKGWSVSEYRSGLRVPMDIFITTINQAVIRAKYVLRKKIASMGGPLQFENYIKNVNQFNGVHQ